MTYVSLVGEIGQNREGKREDGLSKPLNIKEVAAGADSPAAAAEIYLTSLLAINIDNDQERAYLEELAAQLKLPPELVSELLDQAKA